MRYGKPTRSIRATLPQKLGSAASVTRPTTHETTAMPSASWSAVLPPLSVILRKPQRPDSELIMLYSTSVTAHCQACAELQNESPVASIIG